MSKRIKSNYFYSNKHVTHFWLFIEPFTVMLIISLLKSHDQQSPQVPNKIKIFLKCFSIEKTTLLVSIHTYFMSEYKNCSLSAYNHRTYHACALLK